MNIIYFLIFYYFFYFAGRAISKIFFEKNNQNKTVFSTDIYIFYPFLGIFFTSIWIFIFNFFIPLNSFKNLVTFVLILLIVLNAFFIEKFTFNFENILSTLILPTILAISSYNISFHYDAEAYHLTNQSWIINSKIVFGLSNFFIWLGHSSLYEYIQAYLVFGSDFIFQHYLNILFVMLLINFLFFHTIKVKNSYFFSSSLFVIFFGILDNFGYMGGSNGFIEIQMVGKPDVTLGVVFFITAVFLKYGIEFKNSSKLEIKLVLLLFTFAYQLRITALVLILLLIPFVFFNISTFKSMFKEKFIYVLTAYNFLWILKNIIVSSCIFFPVRITCLDYFPWSTSESLNNMSNWVHSYKFDRSLIIFLKDWLNSGYNYIQIPNLLLSLLVLYSIKQVLFKQVKKRNMYFDFLLIIYLFIALYFSFHIRYWFGLIMLIVANIGFHLEFKFHLVPNIKKISLIFLISIMVIGYPRGYSYNYFFENYYERYSLYIDYQDYLTINNESGYGVIAQKNKCYDIYFCSTFQYKSNSNVSYEQLGYNYYIFSDSN